jgi:hypothetical protein
MFSTPMIIFAILFTCTPLASSQLGSKVVFEILAWGSGVLPAITPEIHPHILQKSRLFYQISESIEACG